MKTDVITGGTGGIGKAIALALAKKQYRVIIHGKDPEKAKRTEQEIKTDTGNPQVESIAADISSLRGMKQFADTVKLKTDIIHSLVLSAGVILPKRIETPDGLESGFAIQYLSRFATTQLLMNELMKGKGRIVMVVAPVIPGANIHFEDITLKKNFTMIGAMAQEMFANHLFVQEFARRHPGNEVVINMANPGFSDTGIIRRLPAPIRWAYRLIASKPDKAAENFVYLASNEGVNFSGYFLKKPRKPSVKEKANYDADVAQKLWELSMKLISPIA
jgi:NAD(P)-dependent dehydrogenase (short-subunit alcohol dehydrogenase family)